MGTFNVNVTAVGGHGEQRDRGDGEILSFPFGIDGICKRFVEELKQNGCRVGEAKLTHWPGTTSQVVDDLVSGVRKGSF